MILTNPIIYYVAPITSLNNKVDFDEGGADLVATLNSGTYTMTDLMIEVERALDVAGALDYSVSFVRATRLVTISAGSNFTLQVSTGTNVGTSPWTLLGYSGGADLTSASTYEAPSAMGATYEPQFPLQNYRDIEDMKMNHKAVVNESAGGETELVHFGTRQFMEFNIKYITDNARVTSGMSRSDTNAVQDVRDLLDFLIEKNKFEFMKDKTSLGTFNDFLLDSAPGGKGGTGYSLKEMISQRLVGYYETGTLKFRKL